MSLSWKQARTELTGEAGDGEYGANGAQQILDDLAHFPARTEIYRRSDGTRRRMRYLPGEGQPRYASEPV